MEKQVINLDNDYIKKVQAGILLPKKQHENFELIKVWYCFHSLAVNPFGVFIYLTYLLYLILYYHDHQIDHLKLSIQI